MCQTVADISKINQFHDFLSLIFGGFLQFGPTVQMLIYNEEAFNEVSETEVTTAHKASSLHQTVKPAILKLFETVVPYTGCFQYPKEFYNVL